MSLGQHLGAEQQRNLTAPGGTKQAFERAFTTGTVSVDPGQGRVGKQLPQLGLEALGTAPERT